MIVIMFISHNSEKTHICEEKSLNYERKGRNCLLFFYSLVEKTELWDVSSELWESQDCDTITFFFLSHGRNRFPCEQLEVIIFWANIVGLVVWHPYMRSCITSCLQKHNFACKIWYSRLYRANKYYVRLITRIWKKCQCIWKNVSVWKYIN